MAAFPAVESVRRTKEIMAAADELDTVIAVMGEGRQVLAGMPSLDEEQRRLMRVFDDALEAAIEAGKSLDYRLEVFREKGIL